MNMPPPGSDAAGGPPGARETKRQMLLYTLMLWPASLMPWLLESPDRFYAVCAGALSLLFSSTAIRVWRDDTERSARQMFTFSLFYLFLIFTSSWSIG